MKISISTNWDNQFLENLNRINKEYNCVKEVYGSLKFSTVGTARPANNIPTVTMEEAKKHIDLAHKYGIQFNYTFNPTCTGGVEYHEESHKKILELIDSIVELGVDSMVVAIPYYMELIKKRHPNIYLKVSVMAHVDTLQKLKLWESLGADCIVMCDSNNRDFEMLSRFREEANADLEILTGNACLHHCALQYYHNTLVSHMSQNTNDLKGMYIDYPVLRCVYQKFSHPEELIRARWIRPEDIAIYEKLGFDVFKLGARQSSTEWNTSLVETYAKRKYDGNLLEILQGFEPIDNLENKMETTLNEEHRDMYVQGLSSFSDFNKLMYLDNRKLDGFLEYFKKNKCRYNCLKCNYCKSIADKALSVPDQEKLDTFLETCRFVLGGLVTSELLFE